MRTLAAASLAALLAACAGTGGPTTYQRDYERLSDECAASGGILIPRGAADTGHAGADYACDVRGGLRR